MQHLEARIKKAIEEGDFTTLDELVKQANAHEFLSPNFKVDMNKAYFKLKKELELKQFLAKLAYNSD